MAWRDETFALVLEAWVAMAEDPVVRMGRDPALRKGMEEVTFPLYEQYVTHELAVRSGSLNGIVGGRSTGKHCQYSSTRVKPSKFWLCLALRFESNLNVE